MEEARITGLRKRLSQESLEHPGERKEVARSPGCSDREHTLPKPTILTQAELPAKSKVTAISLHCVLPLNRQERRKSGLYTC